MELQDRIDQAIGEPGVEVDPAQTLAVARRRTGRDRALAAGVSVALVGAVAGGLIWNNRSEPLQMAAEPLPVSISTCTKTAMNAVSEEDSAPLLVTGPAALCVNPDYRVIEQIDQAIGGRTSVALRLGGLVDGTETPAQAVVVWGAFGLDESWGIPIYVVGDDLLAAMTGEAVQLEPLETFVAKVSREPLDAATGRTTGWQHCSGGDRPLWVQNSTVCVGEGFEVLDHAPLGQLAQEMIDKYPEAASEPLDLKPLEKQELWELVDRNGRFHYVAIDTTKADSVREATEISVRLPLYLAAGTLIDPESSQGSASSEMLPEPSGTERPHSGPSRSAQ